MVETLHVEVIHVLGPDELGDADLQSGLRELAESRYVLVCRKGGAPSWLERVKSFLLRQPIEAVTIVADSPPVEGAEVDARVEETGMPGVYDAVRVE